MLLILPGSMAERTFFTSSVLAVVLVIFITYGPAHCLATYQCPTSVFNFGDSLTDTGNVVLAFPYFTDPERPPYGSSFFAHPARRFCNGRLVTDFLAQALFPHFSLLNPYFEQVSPDFRGGVNFAVAGATASNDTTIVPFFLAFQVGQYRKFKNQVESACNQITCNLEGRTFYLPQTKIMPTSFQTGLYTITLGGNDILNQYAAGNLNFTDIITNTVPKIVTAVVAAVQALYSEGARNFIISNVPPQGCATVVLTNFIPFGFPTDPLGCIPAFNIVPLAYNASLNAAATSLRAQLSGISLTIFDYYAANIDILTNAASYGFDPTKTLTACCGIGGPYNYNTNLTCGNSGIFNGQQVTVGACASPNSYINWDGVHFTEAFYRIIAQKVLTGYNVYPPLNITSSCYPDFSKFGNNTSYLAIYGNTCTTLLVD